MDLYANAQIAVRGRGGMVKKITDKAWNNLREAELVPFSNSSSGRMSEELTTVCGARQKSYAEIHSTASVLRELA